MREAASGAGSASEPPEMSGDNTGPAAPGVRDTLARLAASFAAAVDTRVQLAALEFAEERARTRDRLTLIVVAAIAGAFSLLAANALLVVVLWERLGWITLAALTLAWGAVALVAGQRLSALARRERRPFDATLAEFERDRDWIAERVGRGPR
jgi:uncharacterized membrane protein YqjE